MRGFQLERQSPKRQGYADGGMVRGKGTGTSDSIKKDARVGSYIMPADSTEAIGEQTLAGMGKKVPVAVSNGEFEMPPEQVHAIGVQALDQIKNATHTPVRGFNPAAQPVPRQFFADGGSILDKLKHSRLLAPTIQGIQDVPYNFKRHADKGDYAGAIGSAIGDAGKAAVAQSAAPSAIVGDAAWRFGKGMFGVEDSPAALPTSTGKVDAPQPNAASQSDRAQPAKADAPVAAPNTPAAANSTSPVATELANGVYKHGRGQYSDSANGMGFSTGFTGQPSAQNMQAANALASQQQAQSTARVQAAQQQAVPQARGFTGFEMPRQENAYEREARQRERNRIMGMLQTPLTGDPRRDLTASQRQQLVAQLGQESQERQSTERNMFGLAGQQLNAETQRYSTDASTAVGMARNSIDQQRLGLDGQRLGLDAQQQQEQSQVRGFDIRAAQRKEGVLQRYDAAKTDEDRAALIKQFPDVFGRDSQTKMQFHVIRGKNDSGDYAVAFNPATGQIQRMDIGGASQPYPPIPQVASERVVGHIYTAPNGQEVKWDGKGLLPV